MDLQTPPRPTGRQKITLAQLAAEAAKPLAVPATTPGRALAAFKRAAPAMGLPRRVVDLVDCLMSYTHAQDWDGGPGPGAIVWPSDVELEDRLQVGPSQRKVIVRAALVDLSACAAARPGGATARATSPRRREAASLTPMVSTSCPWRSAWTS